MGKENDNCAVKIAVRERPYRDSFKCSTEVSVVSYHQNSKILVVDERPFTFDHVFGPSISQSQVFDDLVKPLVGYFNQGFNCTALAYGQTGTGKSYTMGFDSVNFDGEHIGVIPRCLKEIFKSVENEFASQDNTMESASKLRELSASFIEIYNEKVYDLLADNAALPILSKGYRYTGGIKKILRSIRDCYTILLQGNKNRHVRPTKMNSASSRSHAIFTIYLRQTSRFPNGVESVVSSCMNVVDLAGSEGVRRTGHQGIAMSEGVYINQGLLSIGKVLQAITVGNKVIPYRDSVLSSVLQDSLNANSYLTLLACISPHREDLSETLSTLRFAQNAKQLKNTPQINNIIADIKKNAKHKQTPYKVKQTPINNVKHTPFKRSLAGHSVVPYKTPIKCNTFCTPKKQRMEINKCNQTEIIEIHKRTKFSNIGMNLPKMDQLNSTNRSSLDLNASMSSLNVSSTIAVDAAANHQVRSNSNILPLSFSPVIRKCLTELESGLEKKVAEILQRHMLPFVASQTPAPDMLVESILPPSMRSEIKSIMKEVLSESRTLKENSAPQTNAKCQLFSKTEELFKIPAVPVNTARPQTSSPNLAKDHDASFIETFFTDAAETDSFNTSSRHSKRLSQRLDLEDPINDENNPKMLNGFKSNSFRRSTRKSVLEKTSKNILIDKCIPNKTLRRSLRIRQYFDSPTNVDGKIENKIRKSMRRSVLQKERKINKEEHLHTCCNIPNSNQKQSHEKPNSNNKIIQNCYNGSSLSKHRKAILDLLNEGSIKQVQILPMIGPKRAFQIITHRTLHGKFKNLGQVEKLTLWRGSEWTRFAEANFLV